MGPFTVPREEGTIKGKVFVYLDANHIWGMGEQFFVTGAVLIVDGLRKGQPSLTFAISVGTSASALNILLFTGLHCNLKTSSKIFNV